MGFFDRFKAKEEHTHIDRETGQVTKTIRQGRKQQTYVDGERIEDGMKELTYEEQFKQRRHPWDTPKYRERKAQRKAERDAYMKGVQKGKIANASLRGYRAGTQRFSPSVSPYRITNNYNPFGSMFDTGMKPMSKPKTTKKKKKKGKHTTKTHAGEFDMLDNWGYFK